MTATPEVTVSSITLILFGILQVLTIQRWRLVNTTVVQLGLFISLGFFANLFMLLDDLNVTSSMLDYELATQFSLLASILAFAGLTLSALRKKTKQLLIFWMTALTILFLWSALALNFQGWADDLLAASLGSNFEITGRQQLLDIIAVGGWSVALLVVLFNLLLETRRQHLAHFKNRLRYWLIVTLLLGGSGVGLFANITPGFQLVGLPLLTAAAMLATYNVLSYQTPDLKLLFNWGLHYAGVTFAVSSVTLLGLVGATLLYRYIAEPMHLLTWLIILAIAMGSLYQPLFTVSNYLLTRLIFGKTHPDEKMMIRKYNQNIRGNLDVRRLSDTTVDLMVESLGIKRAVVFVNERNGRGPVSLKPLASAGLNELEPRQLSLENPLIEYFQTEKESLSQYELDIRPEFRSMVKDEREWLTTLGIELYVPVLRNQELLGILAFGPQSNGSAYSKDQKELITTLADQTALAMEGALLFQQLSTINQEVGLLNSRLSILDQSKSEFLSIASHELKTPLTQIHTYSQLLLDLTEEDLHDEAYIKRVFEGIARGSERMKEVIDLMLDVSAADLGHMHLFTGPVAMHEVYQQAIQPFLPVLDERRLALRENGLSDLPAIEADGTRLVQVLENLVGNAIKYTPDGGQISVRGREIVTDQGKPAIEVAVKDNGIGLDPEHHQTVFEKFFRVEDSRNHSTSKTRFKGAGPGLGLTLVKAIVETHNGTVWVKSIGRDEVNRPGTTFCFTLPLVSPVVKNKKLPQSEIVTQTLSH